MSTGNGPRGQTPRRAVAYVRVSAVMGRGMDEFHSPELQRRAMRDYVKRNDLVEVATYEDIDRSGRDFSRAGVQQAFADARAGKYDVLVLYDLSRFGRNTADSLQNIRDLREHGVSVVSTREQFDDTPEGQFQLTQFLAMNQLRSEQIGRQWQETHRYRLEAGRWHGVPPVGYRRPGKGQPIEPDGKVAEAVTKAFRDYAAGRGVRRIARDLSEARGKEVAPITVRRMLRSRAYLGEVRFYETETRRRKDGRTYRARIPGTEQTLPGEHEPLVDRELFDQVQARVSSESSEPPRRRAEPVDPLSGLVVCGECEARMVLHKVRGRQKQTRHFECPRRNSGVCAGVGSPSSHVVLESVLGYVSVWALGEPPAAAGASLDAERRARDLEDAQREVGDLEASLSRLTALLVSGGVTQQAYEVTAQRYDKDLARARERLARLEAAYAPQSGEDDPVGSVLGTLDPADPESFLSRARRVAAMVDDGSFADLRVAEQNRLLKGLVRRVVLGRNPGQGRGRMDERVTIDWV